MQLDGPATCFFLLSSSTMAAICVLLRHILTLVLCIYIALFYMMRAVLFQEYMACMYTQHIVIQAAWEPPCAFGSHQGFIVCRYWREVLRGNNVSGVGLQTRCDASQDSFSLLTFDEPHFAFSPLALFRFGS